MIKQNYRLYSFVANGYLSPLQCGLQTAHVVGEIANDVASHKGEDIHSYRAFFEWAEQDKTIIICAAFNHQGVVDCYAELERTGRGALCLPSAIFREDERSMNSMATACGIVVPQKYWDTKFVPAPEPKFSNQEVNPFLAKWVYLDVETGRETEYPLTHPEGQFIDHIKGYRLA
jgi:hypothetical protein